MFGLLMVNRFFFFFRNELLLFEKSKKIKTE